MVDVVPSRWKLSPEQRLVNRLIEMHFLLPFVAQKVGVFESAVGVRAGRLQGAVVASQPGHVGGKCRKERPEKCAAATGHDLERAR